MLRLALGLGSCLLLAACVTAPPAPTLPRDQIRDFSLEARFALRLTPADRPPQNSAGRLSWEHRNGEDRVLLANPLGIGLAEIEVTPVISRLHTADGQHRESPDADALMEEVTGQSLPVRRLPAWLLGKAAPGTLVEADTSGRPQRFREAGWQIEYVYDGDAAGALPLRLTLVRDQEIELRLRIESWKDEQ